ncbi:porphobilinogen synthase [bacterium CG17_big_fil_post_rev_8_21_14_2_50_64_8]|nr:MAG: porphobilinogen synthase [bacterium CG17_big_fil_post_rev_8_21_14_2_50_64_8]PJA76793.1 MAG: porphobilinogen synthase [bacterium CG_4_9_14_3_um_filter_65_15]
MNLLDRPRRLRANPVLREMCAETDVCADHLITPHFVVPGKGIREEIPSMPGIHHVSTDQLIPEIEADLELGLRSHLLFGVPEHKDEHGDSALDDKGVVQQSLRAMKKSFGSDIIAVTDVCLCAYTSHGHCGFLEDGVVVNDPSVKQLARMALSHAQAGADIVSPSDMMDGRVGAIREKLDAGGFVNTSILAYSAKYASAYYGPFRDACDSAPQGDRKTYQMDPRNGREAVLEVLLDLQEGADMVMVKPALAYLDIVRRVRAEVLCPVVCYNVSGEYSLVKAAAKAGLVDEAAIVRENLMSMRRAGSDLIITYHGRDALSQGWVRR